MADEVRGPDAVFVSRKLWIPFLVWVIALCFLFRGHFLEKWHQNQLLLAVRNPDQQTVETMLAFSLFGNLFTGQ